jgi:hypothetical protein
MDSQRKFGLNGNGNPNYGREAVGFFSYKNQSLTRSWPLNWRGYFAQGIKWHAPLGLNFGAWPLEASHYAWPKAPLTVFYWLFQLISLNSQQTLATQSHGLSTWTAIM